MAKANGSNKMRKVGRNALFCKSYRNTNRREKNKVVRLKKHLLLFPQDLVAEEAVKRCKTLIRGF
jgi:hypothetical protein